MAYESTAVVGSGVSVLREPGVQNVRNMRGSNSVVVNYEDFNSLLGISRSSQVTASGVAREVTDRADRLSGRRKMFLQNLGPDHLFIGSSNVTPFNGIMITSGTIFTVDILDYSEIWIVSQGISDVRVMELR